MKTQANERPDHGSASDAALSRLTVDGQPDNLWRLASPDLPDGASVAAERQVIRDAILIWAR